MGDRVYISKNMNSDQISFIQLLKENEIEYFTIDDIQDRIGQNYENINEVLENLVKKKFLVRLQRKYYADINFNNSNVIGTFICKNSAVGYWSALSHYGLTERFPNTVYIQTINKKSDKTILGVSYKFINIKPEKRAGITKAGYGNNQFFITDIEKTLTDCFDLPKNSGGFDILIPAFQRADMNAEKLIEYAKLINNIAATKRMGFLAELFNKEKLKKFITYAKSIVNERYNVIDPGGSDEGEFENKWRLRLNVSKEKILNIADTEY
jgi:predicted transcriptional regulator of viral defense system